MDKEKILTFVEELTETLNFRRVVLLTLLVAIGLLLFLAFENRAVLFAKASEPWMETDKPVTEWALSETSKQSLIKLTQIAPIGYIGVIDVDLKKNRRISKFRYLTSPEIKASSDKQAAAMLPQAVFDYDAKNTQQMVSILSNEFNCVKSQDTIYQRWYPDLTPKIPTICRLAVPPFVGQFVGYIVVGLNRQVSKSEMDSIRLEISRIAVEIYLRDVTKKSKS